MRTDDFDFDLPKALIAQRPAEPREAARLLVVGDGLTDSRIAELPSFLKPGDILVINDTKVIPARLTGRRGQARIEVTLHKREGPDRWRAFARPAKRLRPGDRVDFAPEMSEAFGAEVAAKGEGGEIILDFDRAGAELMAALAEFGAAPLPPYIQRNAGPDDRDREDYQTVFAAREGAVAAPTAGLHFTEALLSALEARGLRRVAVTLHVGAGTFLPVKAEDPRDHRMHSEVAEITPEAAETINAAKAAGGRIVAVGTTALRVLEAAARDNGHIPAFSGETELFILPGYRFKAVDLLLTNFHLPRSTLFMLVSAFAGLEQMKQAYAHAIGQGYRFFSYGDACLLTRQEGA